MITFEVIADAEQPSVGSIISDASRGAIDAAAADTVIGYAAYGRSIKAAVMPLVDSFDVELFDDGTVLRAANGGLVTVAMDELGNSEDGKQMPRIQREQTNARELPGLLRLTYYDPSRDYQTGEAQAAAGEGYRNDVQQDLPAVLQAGDAKALAHATLARTWSGRDRLTLRLPPGRLGLEPGARLNLALNPSEWRVEKTAVEGFVLTAELRPSAGLRATIASDGGRSAENPDIPLEPLTLALLDVPNVVGFAPNGPMILLAATAPNSWQRRPVEISFGSQSVTVDPARAKSIVGSAESALPDAASELIDAQNSVIVALIDAGQWLTSCDDEGLAGGENLAVLGNELIQFGSAVSLGGGRFRLSRLLRGRGGSEWASRGHSAGETFCLLETNTLQPIALPNWSIGANLSGTSRNGAAMSITFQAEGARPPSPVDLDAHQNENGDLALSWTRRSRQGFAWIDGVDAPLGEASEQYRVNVSGGSGSIERQCDAPSLTVAAADLAVVGAGVATIEVRQIGDVASSHPAKLSLTLC